jgi:hypothetical protein
VVVNNIRKPTNILSIVLSGECCSEYLVTAAFVEVFGNLFGSYSGGTHVDPGKTLRCPLGDNSPHVHYWAQFLPQGW